MTGAAREGSGHSQEASDCCRPCRRASAQAGSRACTPPLLLTASILPPVLAGSPPMWLAPRRSFHCQRDHALIRAPPIRVDYLMSSAIVWGLASPERSPHPRCSRPPAAVLVFYPPQKAPRDPQRERPRSLLLRASLPPARPSPRSRQRTRRRVRIPSPSPPK